MRVSDDLWSDDLWALSLKRREARAILESDSDERNGELSPDGQRFLVIEDVEPGGSAPRLDVVLVDDWLGELERLVPAD